MTSQRNPVSSISLADVANLGVCGNLTSLGASLDELDGEDVTLVSFVLDMSSSMQPVASDVIAAYEAETRALRAAKSASTILVSTTTFADAPSLLHGYLKIDGLPPLDHTRYHPNGCTALYDAVLGVLGRLEAYRQTLRDNGVRARGVVVVLTDGEDNASTHRADDVKHHAESLLRTEGITLAYAGFGSGAQGAALRAQAKKIGFPDVLTASQSAKDIRRVLGQVSQSLLRTAAPAGGSFF